MRLIKDTLGNILLLDGINTVQKWADIATELILNIDMVVVRQTGVDDYAMFPQDIESYQVLPALAVPFSGSASVLMDVLKDNLFSSATTSIVIGGGSTSIARYRKASYQTFTQSLPSITTAAAYANALFGYYITVLEDTNITEIQARLNAGSAGSAVFGVYSVTANGYPDAKLFQTAVLDTALTTPQLTIAPQTLPAGNYFVCMNCTTALCSFYALTAASLYNQFAGVGDTIVTTGYFSGWYINNAYNDVMPATFPAGASLVGLGNIPYITFKTAP